MESTRVAKYEAGPEVFTTTRQCNGQRVTARVLDPSRRYRSAVFSCAERVSVATLLILPLLSGARRRRPGGRTSDSRGSAIAWRIIGPMTPRQRRFTANPEAVGLRQTRISLEHTPKHFIAKMFGSSQGPANTSGWATPLFPRDSFATSFPSRVRTHIPDASRPPRPRTATVFSRAMRRFRMRIGAETSRSSGLAIASRILAIIRRWARRRQRLLSKPEATGCNPPLSPTFIHCDTSSLRCFAPRTNRPACTDRLKVPLLGHSAGDEGSGLGRAVRLLRGSGPA